jgi:hypothetical protein
VRKAVLRQQDAEKRLANDEANNTAETALMLRADTEALGEQIDVARKEIASLELALTTAVDRVRLLERMLSPQ